MMTMMVSKVVAALEAEVVAEPEAEVAEEDVAVEAADPTTTVAVVAAIARAKLPSRIVNSNNLMTTTGIVGLDQRTTTLVVEAQALLAPLVAAAIIGTARQVALQAVPIDPTTTTKSTVATTSPTVTKSRRATSNVKCKTIRCTDVNSDNLKGSLNYLLTLKSIQF